MIARADQHQSSYFSSQSSSQTSLQRLFLLLVILLAFARLTYRLDAKDFWWDESLSLQRAESSWLAVLRGELVISDGVTNISTTDQHPFFTFLIQAAFVRWAGQSEFVVRFPSLMAATLLVATVWIFGRFLERKQIVPAHSALFAVLLCAINPFFLWYGQEARPYAAWAMFTLLSTYLLARSNSEEDGKPTLFLGYLMTLSMLLTTHYLAVYIIPVHALLLLQRLTSANYRKALLGPLVILGIGGLAGLSAVWNILGRYGLLNSNSGVGDNFPERVPLNILIPDLLNAFTLGLSVNINDVWWIDVIAGVTLLLGVLWGVRSRKSLGKGGWILPVIILVPILAIQVVSSFFHAPYMNARHMSLIGGPMIVLLASGIALVWHFQRVFAGVLLALFVVGSGYSSYNYYTVEYYDKEWYGQVGDFLQDRMLPGDILLFTPPHAWRVFAYYLPKDVIEQAAQKGATTAYKATPLLGKPPEATFQLLEGYRSQYNRIWLVVSGTPSEADPEDIAKVWLEKNTNRLHEVRFHAYQSILDLFQYVPKPPVIEKGQPLPAIQQPVDAHFGDAIKLVGLDTGAPLRRDMARPVTFYWQKLTASQARYKYILQLVQFDASGAALVLATTEREPFDAAIPTSFWQVGQTIIETSNLPPIAQPLDPALQYELRLSLYDATTQEKLAIHQAGQSNQLDENTISIPYVPLAPYVAMQDAVKQD